MKNILLNLLIGLFLSIPGFVQATVYAVDQSVATQVVTPLPGTLVELAPITGKGRSVTAKCFVPFEMVRRSPFVMGLTDRIINKGAGTMRYKDFLNFYKNGDSKLLPAAEFYEILAKKAQTAFGIPQHRQLPLLRQPLLTSLSAPHAAMEATPTSIRYNHFIATLPYSVKNFTLHHEAKHVHNNDSFWGLMLWNFLKKFKNDKNPVESKLFKKFKLYTERLADRDGAYATACEHCIRTCSWHVYLNDDIAPKWLLGGGQHRSELGYLNSWELAKVADDLKGHVCDVHQAQEKQKERYNLELVITCGLAILAGLAGK